MWIILKNPLLMEILIEIITIIRITGLLINTNKKVKKIIYMTIKITMNFLLLKDSKLICLT